MIKKISAILAATAAIISTAHADISDADKAALLAIPQTYVAPYGGYNDVGKAILGIAYTANAELIANIANYALANPVEYYNWINKYGWDVKDLVRYYVEVANPTTLTDAQDMAITHGNSLHWRLGNNALWAQIKADGGKLGGIPVITWMLVVMAGNASDYEYLAGMSTEAIMEVGLGTYYTALSKSLINASAQTAYDAYTRCIRIFSPFHPTSANDTDWSRLLSAQESMRVELGK